MSLIIGQKLVSATGGTITNISGYTVHTFTSSGTFTPSQNGTVEALVVGAGGSLVPISPPAAGAGGGGGGSVIYRKFIPVGAGVSYSISIGQVIAPLSTASTITHPEGPITAPGGGAAGWSPGGGGNVPGVSNPVGSGGGGSQGGLGGVGAGITGFGFPGGNGGPGGSTGGGGGAGGAGFNATPAGPGNGGIGVSYSITGVSSYYGVGGGGGNNIPSFGVPNNNISLPQVSIYGRGKQGTSTPAPSGGPDGPGIVIIRYIS